MVDQLFDAGADRISMSLEIWDEELAKKINFELINITR